MKVSIANNVLVEFFGEEKCLEMLAAAGFDTVDYSFFIPGAPEQLLADDYLQKAENSKRLLAKYGMTCNQAHAGFTFKHGMPMNTDCPEYRFTCRCIEYAALVGAKDIVVHTIKVPNETVDFVEYNIAFFQSLEPLCDRFGIRIAVENASGAIRLERLNRLAEALPAEHFVVCLDIGHAKMVCIEPADFARAVTPGRIHSLHVHDNREKQDDHNLPFLGDINWQDTLEALVEIGYDGDFTMEAGKFLRAFPKELTQDALNLYYRVGRYLADRLEAMQKEAKNRG